MTDQRPTAPTRRTLDQVLATLAAIDFHETMAAYATDYTGRVGVAQDEVDRHQAAVDELIGHLDQVAVEHGLDVDQITALAQRQAERDAEARR